MSRIRPDQLLVPSLLDRLLDDEPESLQELPKLRSQRLIDLKQSVQNAVYEQKDPLIIYKFESFDLFRQMLDRVNKDIISFLMKGAIPIQESGQVKQAQRPQRTDMSRLSAGRDSKAFNCPRI